MAQPPAQPVPSPSDPSGGRGPHPLSRPLVATSLVAVALLAIGGGIFAVSVLSSTRTGDPQGPVVTPTREQFIARAGEAVRNSSWLEAEAVLREAIAIYDRDQELRLQLADVLRTRATAAAWRREADGTLPTGGADASQEAADAQARTQDSIDAYQQVVMALEIGPRSAEVEFRAGLLASEAGEQTKAIEHFQASRTAAPDNAEYALYLAQAQLAAGQTPAAKASLLACVNLDPDNAIAWGTLAEVFLRENKPDLAINHIEHARRIQPDVTLWRLVHARALKRRGDAEEALQLLIALPEPEQRDGPVLSLIAECYAYLGRPADAADRYGAASDARPTDAVLALEAARWYQRVENLERARLYADRASMLGNPDGQTLAAELRGE